MVIDDFITPEILATFWGLVGVTALIVQSTKGLIKERFSDWVVRVYAYIVALTLVFVFARQGTGIQGFVLNLINALTIAIGATGSYEVVVDPLAEKEKGEDIDG